MHENRVLQIDVGAHNILLDKYDDLKFCDFAGSSIDGEKSSVAPSAHSSKYSNTFRATVETELFALGSLLYEIETTYKPYHDKEPHEVEELFCADVFPDTQHILLGLVIQKCWNSQYGSVAEALADIHQIQKHHQVME